MTCLRYGFNGGSAGSIVGMSDTVSRVAVSTTLGGAAGGLRCARRSAERAEERASERTEEQASERTDPTARAFPSSGLTGCNLLSVSQLSHVRSPLGRLLGRDYGTQWLPCRPRQHHQVHSLCPLAPSCALSQHPSARLHLAPTLVQRPRHCPPPLDRPSIQPSAVSKQSSYHNIHVRSRAAAAPSSSRGPPSSRAASAASSSRLSPAC